MWKNINRTKPDSAHYSIMSLLDPGTGMASLRDMFPDGEANELNFVLFSTSGVHGTYNTIEEAENCLFGPAREEGIAEVTFLIVHPRLVSLRYGVCNPITHEDVYFLKKLRSTSHNVVAGTGE
jgi:hypothetical protein